jgi:hypothetical protein
MAQLMVEGDELVVRLTRGEKFWAFHGNVRVPLSAVRSVSVPEYPLQALRGWRMAGTGFPGLVVLGTRRHANGYDFVAIHRQQMAVQVDLNGPPRWQRILVSLPADLDPQAEARAIAAAAGDGARATSRCASFAAPGARPAPAPPGRPRRSPPRR